uniref:K Homology domain-containing protein n=1 Tax=Ditylenchus dipsaci TaxID=166011 RepID=A0A915DZ63_9BILA
MKRSGHRDDRRSIRASIVDPTKAAGAVIGKGGENVNALSRKYNASISVPDKRTAERVVTIVARKEDMLDCFKDVMKIIVDQERRGKPEIRVIVHQSHVGVIMGRQGANVKELGAKTKTQITIFKDVCPDSTDRVVLIVGDEENIADVVKSLIKDMADFTIRSLQRPYDAANYDPRNASLYGGIVTSGYDDDRGRGRDRYVSPHRPTPGAHDDYRRRDRIEPFLDRGRASPPRFDRDAVALAVQQQQLQLQQQQLQRQAEQQAQQQAQQQPAMAFSEAYLRGADVASVQMAIPKELSGKVTGSSGEIVSRIQQDSGARIDIGVTITGTPQQIEVAQMLIKQSIRKPDPSPQQRSYYVDEHMMNERIPDESGLVSRKPEIAATIWMRPWTR